MNLFDQTLEDYSKNYYVTIPDVYGSKKPAIKGWTQYALTRPSITDLETWSAKKQANVSLMLGKLSRVICVDVDTEEEEVLDYLSQVLPTTPAVKVGRKGYTAFYRYDERIVTDVVKLNNQVAFEILSDGKKTTIPPSMHPSGAAYYWRGESLDTIDPNTLPKLPPNIANGFRAYFAGKYGSATLRMTSTGSLIRNEPTGRNQTLKEYITKDLSKQAGNTFGNIINLMLAKDLELYPDNSYFSDPTEHRYNDPKVNAAHFFTSVITSYQNKEEAEGGCLEIFKPMEINISKSSSLLSDVVVNIEEESLEDLPNPKGLVAVLQKYLLDNSNKKQPALSLGASIAMLGTLISRRYSFRKATTNTMTMLLAPSGAGKNINIKAASSIFPQIKAVKFLGREDLGSSAAYTFDLAESPVRLDYFDEAHKLVDNKYLKANPHMADIKIAMTGMFTASMDYYNGRTTKMVKNEGACARPNISTIMASTFSGMTAAIKSADIDSGFLPRVLFFKGGDPCWSNTEKVELKEADIHALEYLVEYVKPGRELTQVHTQMIYSDIEIKCTEESDKKINDLGAHWDNKRRELDENNPLKVMYTRNIEYLLKLSLIHRLGRHNFEDLSTLQVELEDVEFARQVIELSNKNYGILFSDYLVSGDYKEVLDKIYDHIKLKKQVTKKQLGRKYRHILKHASERDRAYSELQELGFIGCKTGINGTTYYYPIDQGGVENVLQDKQDTTRVLQPVHTESTEQTDLIKTDRHDD